MPVTQVGRLIGGLTGVPESPAGQAEGSFKSMLNAAITQVESLERASDSAVEQLVKGRAEDLHQVMIVSEKATLGLQLAIAVRNKVLEAYQEIMRMQV